MTRLSCSPRVWLVKDRPLAEIWHTSAAFDAFRGEAWMPEPCRSCDRRTLDFGGCRCQAFHLTGDAAATDPVCLWPPITDSSPTPGAPPRRPCPVRSRIARRTRSAADASAQSACVAERALSGKFSTVFGWLSVGNNLGTATGPLLSGAPYDLTHSYLVIYATAATLVTLAINSLTIFIRTTTPPPP